MVMVVVRPDNVLQVLCRLGAGASGRLPGVTCPTPPLVLEVPCMHHGLPLADVAGTSQEQVAACVRGLQKAIRTGPAGTVRST